MNRASTANQLTLFDSLGTGWAGRVRVHVSIRDRARRQAVSKILARSPKLTVVTGTNGSGADVRVFDDASSAIRGSGPNGNSDVPGVLIGPGIVEDSLLDALCNGISAIVPAGVDRKTLEDVLIKVAGGECMLLGDIGRSSTAAKLLVGRLKQSVSATGRAESNDRANPFSDREQQIMTGIAKGHSSPVIADELSLSVQTVKNYVTGILTKTGARNRAHAVAVATDRGWLG